MGVKSQIADYVKLWENRCYANGIPDEAPPELESNDLVPSYKRICRAIIKNDLTLSSLGYEKRKSLVYDQLKKSELMQRGKITQLRLFP